MSALVDLRGIAAAPFFYVPQVAPRRKLAWVDGVNSAVMAYLVLQHDPEVVPIHVDLGDSVHEDSHRFINDLEQWYGVEIVRVRSEQYNTIDDVFEHRSYLSGINGAPCTGAMKVVPRMNYQLPSDTHYWGYTADKLDAKRFYRMCEAYPLLQQESPLIDIGMKKEDTHAFLADHGIRRPWVYESGCRTETALAASSRRARITGR